MKASEFRERSTSELKGLERDLARELWKARFDNYTNQLDNSSKIKRLRRNIACVKTILTERERQVTSAASKE
ncbi:MAG: 50S ribosomal protein L29 [Deltaproteobacteria bacterium]|nr:50S ribosomal protein L29 [Deltaproteobacteria bacterium]